MTLADVAKVAGVSAITASRALNTPNRVSQGAQKRVRDAVERTGYVPNMVAGGLASSRSRLVAALVPTIAGPVFLETVQALTEALAESGYQLMLGQSGYGGAREDALLDAIIGRRPDGIVLTGIMHSAEGRRRLLAAGIPVVETWDLTPTPIDMLVGFSHEKVGHAVAEYLFAQGRRKLAIVTADDHRAGLRRKGFEETATRLGIASPSVTARLFGVFVKDGIDPFMAEASVLPYDIANTLVELAIHDAGVRVGYWRSVSHALNCFANESFIDELASAAGKDPVAYRTAMLTGKDAERYRNVLSIATTKAGWGKAPKGRFHGVALMEGYGTYVAQVSEVSIDKGEIRVHKVTCAVDCGMMVNPDIVKAQVESSVAYGMSAALLSKITFKDGMVEQSNFHDYQVLRMNQMPVVDVHLVQSTEKPGGIGEPVVATCGPSVANAVFAATGKRVRKLPIEAADLKTA